MVRIINNEIKFVKLGDAIKQAQAIVKKYVPKGVSIVDELITDRRQEAKQEFGEHGKIGKSK